MTEKYCCVIDAAGRYVTYVIVLNNQIQHYTLKDGETLIDAKPPAIKHHIDTSGFVQPAWDADTSTWVEGATEEEIAAWEACNHVLEPETETDATADEILNALLGVSE